MPDLWTVLASPLNDSTVLTAASASKAILLACPYASLCSFWILSINIDRMAATISKIGTTASTTNVMSHALAKAAVTHSMVTRDSRTTNAVSHNTVYTRWTHFTLNMILTLRSCMSMQNICERQDLQHLQRGIWQNCLPSACLETHSNIMLHLSHQFGQACAAEVHFSMQVKFCKNNHLPIAIPTTKVKIWCTKFPAFSLMPF